MRIVHLIRASVGHDHVANSSSLLSLLLESERVTCDDQISQCWQLSHCVEQFLFMRHLVECKVELFEIGEDLLAHGK